MLCRIQPLRRQTPLRQYWFSVQALLRAGQDATSRDSYAPLPSCRISEFLAAPFGRNRRFAAFRKFRTLWMRERRARWRVLRVRSQYSLHPRHICTGTGAHPAHIGTRTGSPCPHLHRDWAHSAHICAGTACAGWAHPAHVLGTRLCSNRHTSVLGLPRPHPL